MAVSKGSKTVLFFQAKDDATTDGNKLRLAFQTEHTFNSERETIEESTKDGVLKGVGEENANIEFTCYVVRDNKTYQLLKESYRKGEEIQAWEVDITEESKNGKYPATYVQGTLSNFNRTSSNDNYTELSSTFNVNLTPQDGEVTLTPEQFAAVQYAFNDFGQLAGGSVADSDDQDEDLSSGLGLSEA
ncbi:phage major tail protein, TP901-1 family [Staphylococcus felis]|uniref:phage major tail protein, TP901-1 family n=1 Tax=Staphylococcus felis TaxID=46127 RepID=UPI000CD2E3D1|nr:phage major tail protein, TP901-1 family [Staphylococcus felis]AVP37420.1 phage major tail protein, TP901-1 family [Staphylococcus felis]PNZ37098.1 phage major tail protein, TP901-1 family [Staphylococcus felis]QQB02632.1 phage major tail protein, TP901-1 family [Staphylococcus felis]REI09539.1 phage major tail protein, TP901-1 family [Staphylococcus felis]REI33585.1 phage major tail protein, TP901-1 family [Staphylococcus felis]